jgi:putative transposase
VIPVLRYPAEVRKIIYTTNAIERLNASVRKAVHNKGHFPSHQAATKLIWLALRHITENWKRPPIAWQASKARLAIQFGERFVFNN